MGENMSFNIEPYKVLAMLEQTEELVRSGQLTRDNALVIIGNLVDCDKDEPSNQMEETIYTWMQNLMLNHTN